MKVPSTLSESLASYASSTVAPQIIFHHDGFCSCIQEVTGRIKVDTGDTDSPAIGSYTSCWGIRGVMGIAQAFLTTDYGKLQASLHVESSGIHYVYRFSFLRCVTTDQTRYSEGLTLGFAHL
jgi:hypothetical protein